VLLTGGYLVLEQAYTGLVIGTSARFYTVINSENSGTGAAGTLTVRSPQFDQATWQYKSIAKGDKLEFESMYVEHFPLILIFNLLIYIIIAPLKVVINL
jgi:phosphomevalonate kinase